MSLVDKIRPGPKPIQPLQADAVLAKLKAAEAVLGELEAQHGAAALDAVVGGSDTALAKLNRNITMAREKVATLQSAHKAALDRDEATVNAQRAALRKTQVAAMRKHLDGRHAAAVALSAAIAEAAQHYATLLNKSQKASAACPLGDTWPGGSCCETDVLRDLVAHEFYRISSNPGNTNGAALPGAVTPDMNFQWNPEAITPLVDKLAEANTHTIAVLTGKAD